MLYPMKRDVSVVFSASYVAYGARLLIYAIYNLKAWAGFRLPHLDVSNYKDYWWQMAHNG